MFHCAELFVLIVIGGLGVRMSRELSKKTKYEVSVHLRRPHRQHGREELFQQRPQFIAQRGPLIQHHVMGMSISEW